MKNVRKKYKDGGITLIALVVTIVVLLILAGISLNLVIGNNGIINKAKDAKEETRAASVEEEKNLWRLDVESDKYGGSSNAKTLNELVDDLLSRKLVTEEERQTILDTGKVKIGSKLIEFMTDDEIPTIVNTEKKTAMTAGTEENPYQIFSIEDLVQLSINVNAGNSYEGQYIKMMRTLDFNDDNCYLDAHSTSYGNLNENDDDVNEIKTEMTTGIGFTPIANVNGTYFSGNFDANNYKIENIYVNGKSYASFIARVKDAQLSNLEVSGNITAVGPAGIVGEVIENGTFKMENCKNYAIINSTGPGWIGSMICRVMSNAQAEITNCSNYANLGTYNGCAIGGLVYQNLGTLQINGGENKGELQGGVAGGIVQYNNGNLKIDGTANLANLNSSGPNGGIVGYSNTGVELSNCKNTGIIQSNAPSGGIICYSSGGTATISNCKNTGNVISGNVTGGIIGWNSSGSTTIKDCSNTGTLKSGDAPIGGIIGYTNSGTTTISNCNNTGTITAGTVNTGGIIGYTSCDAITIKNCKNDGDITSGASYVGGIIGLCKAATLEECKNTGDITSTAKLNLSDDKQSVGGILGYASEGSTINKCYNEGEINASTYNISGIVGNLTTRNNSIIQNCFNSGDINASGSNYAGGIMGSISTYVTELANCFNIGNISNPNNESAITNAGGIGCTDSAYIENMINVCNYGNITAHMGATGILDVTFGVCDQIENAYNAGNIVLVEGNSSGDLDMNGIIETAKKLKNCYNVGSITNTRNFADGYGSDSMTICGIYRGGNEINDCYNAGEIKSVELVKGTLKTYELFMGNNSMSNCSYLIRDNNAEASGAIGKTEAEMRQITDINNFVTKLNAKVDEHNNSNPEFLWNRWKVKDGKAVFDING